MNDISPKYIYKWRIGVKDKRKYITIKKISARKIYYTQHVELNGETLTQDFCKYIKEFVTRFEIDWVRTLQKEFYE